MTDATHPPTDPAALTGRTEVHLFTPDDTTAIGKPIHTHVVEDFLRLRADAAENGFDLWILSGFRSFDAQLSIWNRKARGELAVLDSQAVPLDINTLGPDELVTAILRWSALPGGSRHHWGTDIDVFDEAARPDGYEVDLIPEEVNPGGMFGPLHEWLDGRMAAGKSHGFFRPYDRDRGGVAPERWHLSHAPTAGKLEAYHTIDAIRQALVPAEMELKDVVLRRLDEIYERFIINIARS
jgi:LAS superfamily LD-carboxypeptidase LdcB